MKTCGIVCEYNPFHLGHKRQLDLLKDMGLCTVCVMSGSFTERAEPAILPKELRAEIAVKNGADLVLELPFPFSSFVAERFAKSAVSIMKDCGFIDCISFGSECGSLDALSRAADCMLSKEYKAKICEYRNADRGLSFARAGSMALNTLVGDGFSRPNDILAIEYLRAIKQLCAPLSPIAIKREGAFHGESVRDGLASASYLRERLQGNDNEEAAKYVPPESAAAFDRLISIDEEKLICALRTAILTRGVDGQKNIAEVGGGLEHSLYKVAFDFEAVTVDDFMKSLSAKHLTSTKIRRMLLFSLMGVTSDDMQTLPAYTRVLAVGKNGYSLLKESKAAVRPDFAIISGASHLRNATAEAKRQFELNRKAEIILDSIKKRMP